MAWIHRPLELEFMFVDDDGAESSSRWHANYSDLDIAPAAAAEFVTVAGALSDCSIIRYSITIPLFDSAPAIPAGADVRRVGAFYFSTSDELLWLATLPGIKNSVVTAPGGTSDVTLDLLHPDVAAYVAAMLDGIGSVQPCDGRGVDLGALVEAYRQWR